MTEVDIIKYALVNVSTLAKTSDYYNPDRDSSDIELIEKIVKDAIEKIESTPIEKRNRK